MKEKLDLTAQDLQKKVVDQLVEGLRKRGKRTIRQQALHLLQALFNHFTFDLAHFLKKHSLSELQVTRFISFLLYALYYSEIKLDELPSDSKKMELLFLTLLAEVLTAEELSPLLDSLSEGAKLHLLFYCQQHLREGAWKILDDLALRLPANWSAFIALLRSQYYEADFPWQGAHLQTIVAELEAQAAVQVAQIAKTLPQLIESLIAYPCQGLQMKGVLHSPKLHQMRQEIEASRLHIEKLFAPYRFQTYSQTELQAFFRIYGLKGHLIGPPYADAPRQSLLELLQAILGLVTTRYPLPLDQMAALMTFVYSLCQTLYTFHHDAALYQAGLKRLVFSLPTQGKELSKLPYLPTLLKGLDALCHHLQTLRLSDYPVILFDQNNRRTFQKNQQFIQQLCQRYPAQIWHLSSKQTIQLAKKIGVHNWIIAHDGLAFGYAGARNCVFLLAPVIQRAAQKYGVRSFKALIGMGKKLLHQLFQEAVLGKTGEDAILYMAEDDLAIPLCNLFTDTLFAGIHGDSYFSRHSYIFGRATYGLSADVDLKSLQAEPNFLFASTYWQAIPFSGGMNGRLSKPAFCLPLPHGCEEQHVLHPLIAYRIPFEQPLIHLGGSRLPDASLPTTPLSGIVKYLKHYLPYSLQISMITYLVDPSNLNKRCILPWNDPAIRRKVAFKNLGELWRYVFLPETLADMKQRFWNNMQAFANEPADNQFIEQLHRLAHLELTPLIPKRLKTFYQEVQQDARCTLDLGQLYAHSYQQPDWEAALRREIGQTFGPQSCDRPIAKSLLILIKTIHRLEGLSPKKQG